MLASYILGKACALDKVHFFKPRSVQIDQVSEVIETYLEFSTRRIGRESKRRPYKLARLHFCFFGREKKGERGAKREEKAKKKASQ